MRRARNTFAVIADDLAGANDIGAQFVEQGYEVTVAVKATSLPDIIDAVDIPVVNIQTRGDSSQATYQKVGHVIDLLRRHGVDRYLAKIDTAFRGNVAATINALLDKSGARLALLAPAIPAMGRITVGGYQLFGQVPIQRTSYASDPFERVTESHIPTMIASSTGRRVAQVGLSQIMAEHADVALQQALKDKAEIVVCDAVSQQDLNYLAECAKKIGILDLTVGSLGMVNALIPALTLSSISTFPKPGRIREGPTLVVSGTFHPQTLAQIERAREILKAPVVEIDATLAMKDESAAAIEILQPVRDALRGGDDLILRSAVNSEDATRCKLYLDRNHISVQEFSQRLSRAFGIILRRLLAESSISCILATGGDTAYGLCAELGASALRVIREIGHAIVHTSIVGGEADGMSFVTKGGSVGDNDALVAALRDLADLKEERHNSRCLNQVGE